MRFHITFVSAGTQKSRRKILRRSIGQGIERLEPRQLFAMTSPDSIELSGTDDLYSGPYTIERKVIVESNIVNDVLTYVLTADVPGSQVIDLQFKPDVFGDLVATHRIQIDPTQRYSIATNSSWTLVIDAFQANGAKIDQYGVELSPQFEPGPDNFGCIQRDCSYVHPADRARFGAVFGSTPANELGVPSVLLPMNASFVSIRVIPTRADLGEQEQSTIKVSVSLLGDEFSTSQTVVQWALQRSLVRTQGSNEHVDADQAYPVTASKQYVLSMSGERLAPNSTPEKHSLGYKAIDRDGNVISSIHVERSSEAADTRLAADLKPGDTVIQLLSALGWSNGSATSPSARAIAWYGYRDQVGNLYPDYSYTRNTASDLTDGLWAPGAINGNTITLRKPWTGPSVNAGTAIRNAVAGEDLFPVLAERSSLPTHVDRVIQGNWSNGVRSPSFFPPGTAAIQPSVVLNVLNPFVTEPVQVSMTFGVDVGSSFRSGNKRTTLIDVLANDAVGTASGTRIISVSQPTHGRIEIVPGVGNNRDQLRYTSDPFFIGSESARYRIKTALGAEYEETVRIAATGSNIESNPSLLAAIQSENLLSKNEPYSFGQLPYLATLGMPLIADGIRNLRLDSSFLSGGTNCMSGW